MIGTGSLSVVTLVVVSVCDRGRDLFEVQSVTQARLATRRRSRKHTGRRPSDERKGTRRRRANIAWTETNEQLPNQRTI